MSGSNEKRPYLLRILGTWGFFLFIALMLSFRLGSIPPLGVFLSPATGYLANAHTWGLSRLSKKSQTLTPETLKFKGLKSVITISTDSREVPHVYADNDVDLAFGQGFATARDRLWQMDIQTMATAGRMSEIVGEKAFQFDVKQRKLGFLAAAEAEVAHIKEHDPEQYEILESYSRGVNAYIETLEPTEWPLEYKILDTSPQPWTPLRSALFHKQMTWMLTGHLNDFKFTNALQKYTPEEIEILFPDFFSAGEPILNESVTSTTPHHTTQTPDTPVNISLTSRAAMPMLPAAPSQPEDKHRPLTFDGLIKVPEEPKAARKERRRGAHGSNNWVVNGQLTENKFPVLANDPHLDLKLPSIWYEIQLTSPNVNVYGVSLPGLPHVIIGFNDTVSWGITNAGTDVLDWSAMKFDKAKPAPQYFFANEWRASKIRHEKIQIRGQTARSIEVIETRLGPIAQELAFEQKSGGTTTIPFAMQWIGHAPSNEFRVFFNLNRARSLSDLKTALMTYQAPAQNFVMADSSGAIGFVQAGRFPRRSKSFGRFVLDGTLPETEWSNDLSFEELPQSWSPPRGFLHSANQQPTRQPPAGYASGEWGFTSYLRGTRIHQHLQELTSGAQPVSLAALKNLQNDVVDLRAKAVLPLFIQWTAPFLKDSEDQKILKSLSNWNFELKASSQEATLWSEWWDTVYEAIWEKAFPAPHFISPSADKTMELLLSDQLKDWPALQAIPSKSELPELVSKSFGRTLKNLRSFAKVSELSTTLPPWGIFRGTRINHIAQLEGFGVGPLPSGGSALTVNATTEHHGPSWRMVVTWIESQPRAWGVFPGGQSGHVGSPQYSNMIKPWLEGQLEELIFARQGKLQDLSVVSQIRLEAQP
jgi:penicillin amidase